MYPAESEVVLVCKAALDLFPNLKGGMVSFSAKKISKYYIQLFLLFFRTDCSIQETREVHYSIALIINVKKIFNKPSKSAFVIARQSN